MCLVCLETISVMKDFHLSCHYNYYNCNEYHACWVWVHWVVSCVVFQFCDIIEWWCMWAFCIDKNTFMENMKLIYVGTINIPCIDFLGSGHPQNATEYRISYLPNSKFCSFSQLTFSHEAFWWLWGKMWPSLSWKLPIPAIDPWNASRKHLKRLTKWTEFSVKEKSKPMRIYEKWLHGKWKDF